MAESAPWYASSATAAPSACWSISGCLRSRPSMEAVGIDVYQMVAKEGWDIYPIGSDDKPEDIPKGTLAGLIVVQ